MIAGKMVVEERFIMLTKEQEEILRKIYEALLPANKIMGQAIAQGKLPRGLSDVDSALDCIATAINCLRNRLYHA